MLGRSEERMPRVSFIARAITSLCVVATEVRMRPA
jgi:hypothetical protein